MTLKQIALAALVATGALAGTAQAAGVMGTGSVALVGVTGTPSGTINLGTTFSFALSLWSSGTNNFTIIPAATVLTTGSITATTGSAVSFSSSFGTFSGSVLAANANGAITNRIVDLYALGNFTPLGVLGAFTPAPMSLTFSATQTGGPTGAISASYTISSPPAPLVTVPEPGALALVGIALAGLAMARRQAKKA